MVERFEADGFALFDFDPLIAGWAAAAHARARDIVEDRLQKKRWQQCEETWFVGVDVLPNNKDGAIDGVPLNGAPLRWIAQRFGSVPPFHPAQISVVYPGYPRPRAGESQAAFRYRERRDAAHVDGLHAVGAKRRRKVREPHLFILGLPLTTTSSDASSMVLWRGSHKIMREAFQKAFREKPSQDWPEVDVTEIYHEARRRCFETCERIALHAVPGQAYLAHPLALHGVAPWNEGAEAPKEGRMIAYFRPEAPNGMAQWLSI